MNNLSSLSYVDGSTMSDKNSPTWMIEVLPMQMERRESMDTGSRLKYHRLKKKMSLEEVSTEILSTKELKKIEAGVMEPSLKELEALCKKLKIPLAAKDNPVGKILVKNFKNALLHPQNKGKIMELYSDIHAHPLLHVNEDIELEYNIQQIRYFIITGDLDSAEEKLKTMENFKEFMNQEQFYLFHKYNGNYHYILNDFDKAFKIYLMAEKIAPTSLSATEKGDLFYSLGISASQLYYSEIAHKYTELALGIYQQEFIPKRIVECHLNLGIIHVRFKNFHQSQEHYKVALTIGRKLDIEILKFTTEYNLGYSYFLNQNHKLTITHMENALKCIPEEYTADKLWTFCFLIMAEYDLGNIDRAKHWVKEGQDIIDSKQLNLDSPTKDTFKIAFIEFMSLSHLLANNYEEFELLILNHLMPHFKNKNNFYEMGYFYNHLGNVYYMQGQFEKSASALKKSQSAFRNSIRIT